MKAYLLTDAGRLIIRLSFDDNDSAEKALRAVLVAQADGTRYEIVTGGGYYNSATGESRTHLEVRPIVPVVFLVSVCPQCNSSRRSIRCLVGCDGGAVLRCTDTWHESA